MTVIVRRKKRREFSFIGAVCAAFILHAGLGVFLKYNPLVGAAPVAPAPAVRPPVTLRFVEVPQGATTVPQPLPDAKYGSDANRKAGPLIPVPKQPEAPKVRQYASGGNTRAAGTSPPAPSTNTKSSNAPAAQNPAAESTVPPTAERGELPAGTAEQLAKSLQNLDQFIGSGTDEGASGSGALQPGAIPEGDPGSGVFFDTQGYDLGPWGNRVVALVKRNWVVPLAAELGQKGIVGISFQVDRRGRILNPRIVSPSGVSSFDQAALAAVNSSNPLPPLPDDFPRPALPAVFRFYYNIPVPD